MRLVDADELIKMIPAEEINARFAVINAKTVGSEQIKKCYWVLEREPNGKPYCLHCSVCDDDFHHISIETAFDYCPHCGAKMDNERIRERLDEK